MRSVLKSYIPFFIWLLLATFAFAQPPHRIGYVAGGPGPTFDAFREGLREAGYVEGRDIVIETRFSEGRADRFPALIGELLERKVDLLVAGSPPGAIAAIKTDTTTPIVIAGVGDPAGIAKRLGRPAAHITGTTLPIKGIANRWLEILRETRPDATHVAVLTNPANPSRAIWMSDLEESARAAGVKLEVHDVGDKYALAKALAAISAGGARALIVTGDPVFVFDRAQIVAFAQECGLATVYFSKLFVDDGGLMAYGPSLEDSYRKAPRYVDRILKGAKPAELAMEPSRVELVVNLRTARAQGVTIPAAIVKRADRVIE